MITYSLTDHHPSLVNMVSLNVKTFNVANLRMSGPKDNQGAPGKTGRLRYVDPATPDDFQMIKFEVPTEMTQAFEVNRNPGEFIHQKGGGKTHNAKYDPKKCPDSIAFTMKFTSERDPETAQLISAMEQLQEFIQKEELEHGVEWGHLLAPDPSDPDDKGITTVKQLIRNNKFKPFVERQYNNEGEAWPLAINMKARFFDGLCEVYFYDQDEVCYRLGTPAALEVEKERRDGDPECGYTEYVDVMNFNNVTELFPKMTRFQPMFASNGVWFADGKSGVAWNMTTSAFTKRMGQRQQRDAEANILFAKRRKVAAEREAQIAQLEASGVLTPAGQTSTNGDVYQPDSEGEIEVAG
jgi:hypothetical protein